MFGHQHRNWSRPPTMGRRLFENTCVFGRAQWKHYPVAFWRKYRSKLWITSRSRNYHQHQQQTLVLSMNMKIADCDSAAEALTNSPQSCTCSLFSRLSSRRLWDSGLRDVTHDCFSDLCFLLFSRSTLQLRNTRYQIFPTCLVCIWTALTHYRFVQHFLEYAWI